MISRCKGRSSFAFILYGVISLHIYFTLCIISSFFMLSCYHLYYLLIAQSDMDTTSSNKGKGVMNAISTDGNPVEKQFKLFDGESLNQQAPAPTTMPYSQSYMAPPNTFYGEPLDVAPLTVAKPGEPVDHTPSSILNHKAYKGGWKVLRYPRPGRVDKVIVHCCHIFSRYNNEILIFLLYELFSCALYLFVKGFLI